MSVSPSSASWCTCCAQRRSRRRVSRRTTPPRRARTSTPSRSFASRRPRRANARARARSCRGRAPSHRARARLTRLTRTRPPPARARRAPRARSRMNTNHIFLVSIALACERYARRPRGVSVRTSDAEHAPTRFPARRVFEVPTSKTLEVGVAPRVRSRRYARHAPTCKNFAKSARRQSDARDGDRGRRRAMVATNRAQRSATTASRRERARATARRARDDEGDTARADDDRDRGARARGLEWTSNADETPRAPLGTALAGVNATSTAREDDHDDELDASADRDVEARREVDEVDAPPAGRGAEFADGTFRTADQSAAALRRGHRSIGEGRSETRSRAMVRAASRLEEARARAERAISNLQRLRVLHQTVPGGDSRGDVVRADARRRRRRRRRRARFGALD